MLSMLSIPAPRPARLSGHIRADFQTRVIQLTLPALSMVVVGPDRKWFKIQQYVVFQVLSVVYYIIKSFDDTNISPAPLAYSVGEGVVRGVFGGLSVGSPAEVTKF